MAESDSSIINQHNKDIKDLDKKLERMDASMLKYVDKMDTSINNYHTLAEAAINAKIDNLNT